MTLTLSKTGALLLSILFTVSFFHMVTISVVAEDPDQVFVDDDFTEITPGWNTTHFSTIQQGIDAVVENGTVFVMNGMYSDFTRVNKTVSIEGENKESVIISDQFYVTADQVSIEYLTLSDISGGDFPSGIYDESSHSSYRHLNIINNTYGIQLSSESFNTTIEDTLFESNDDGVHCYEPASHILIAHNIFQNNVNNGLYLENVHHFTITHNYLLNTAEIGLHLSYSTDNLIYNNYFENADNVLLNSGTNNSFNISKTETVNIIGGPYLGGNYWNDYTGIDENGDGLGDSAYDVAIEVAQDRLPLVYTQLYVDDDADSEWYNANHVRTISEAVDNTSSTGARIFVYNGEYTENVYVDKTVSIIGESRDGVSVTSEYGDAFYVDSPGVELSTMTIADNNEGEGPSAGIYDSSTDASYTDLHLLNNDYGITCYGSTRGHIANCTIENNSEAGIYLRYSNAHRIVDNYIIDNLIGLHHFDTTDNLIYNNYFNNTQNVNITIGEYIYNTSWNISKTPGENILGGSYLGGNFWSDYVEMDYDGDGLGDTPHRINGNDTYVDFLPLTDRINQPPLIGEPTPTHESTNNPLDFIWSIPINDTEEGIFNWNITCSNGQYNYDIEDVNGTKVLHLSNLAYETSYTVSVSVFDYHRWTNDSFEFTTKQQPQGGGGEKKKNPSPVAIISSPDKGFPDESLLFDASQSYDPNGEIISYTWTFGDGSTANGKTIRHSYSTSGYYTVTLSVRDNNGGTDSSSKTISILQPNLPPDVSLDLKHSPGSLSVLLTVTATDADGDPVSCSISWGDGSTVSAMQMQSNQHSLTHVYPTYGNYTIVVTGSDGTVETTVSLDLLATQINKSILDGFEQFITHKDSFLDNQIHKRSILGTVLEPEQVIPAATLLSIFLLFLLNFLIELISDYSSERAIEYRKDKKDKKSGKKQKPPQLTKNLLPKELFAVFVTTLILSFVLTWTWVPDMDIFWETFIIVSVIVVALLLIRETLRSYLSYKHKLHSEFYIWPLGTLMMVVSTFIGNTFSLAANHHYDDEADIKNCGRVSFFVAIVMFLLLVIVFLANLFYHSALLQMIVIVTVLNLFIDLFPLSPMDGYEIRKWNFPIWISFYIIIVLSYIVVYFNLFP